VESASNRYEYQEYFLGGKGSQCIGLTTLPPSRVNCLDIWKPQPPGTLRACPGLQWDCFTILYSIKNTAGKDGLLHNAILKYKVKVLHVTCHVGPDGQ
jgi:hypothetical protein